MDKVEVKMREVSRRFLYVQKDVKCFAERSVLQCRGAFELEPFTFD